MFKACAHLCGLTHDPNHARSIEINYDAPTRSDCAPVGHADHVLSVGTTHFLKRFFLVCGKFEVRFIPLILQKILIKFFVKSMERSEF